MKKVEIIVKASNNTQNLQNAFDEYLKKQNMKNILNLTIRLVEYALSQTNAGSINLCFEKLTVPNASCGDGQITVSTKFLKKMKKIENLPDLISAIYHEICHIIIEQKNAEIICSGKGFDKYLPEFKKKSMFDVLKAVFGDNELIYLAESLYYSKNANEKTARKYGHERCVEILSQFLPNVSFRILSLEEQEKQREKAIYNILPEYNSYIPMFPKKIEEFQQDLISKGIQNLSSDNRQILINSYILHSSNQTKTLLIDAVNGCNNNDVKSEFMQNPLFLQIVDLQKSKNQHIKV